MAAEQPNPPEGAVSTKVLIAVVLALVGVPTVKDAVGPREGSEVRAAIEKLGAELKEMRRDSTETNKTLAVAVERFAVVSEQVRELAHRVGNLETERARQARK